MTFEKESQTMPGRLLSTPGRLLPISHILDVELSPDGAKMAVRVLHRSVKIYETITWSVTGQISEGRMCRNSATLRFSKCGRFLASMSGMKQFVLWDLQTMREFRVYPHPDVIDCAFTATAVLIMTRFAVIRVDLWTNESYKITSRFDSCALSADETMFAVVCPRVVREKRKTYTSVHVLDPDSLSDSRFTLKIAEIGRCVFSPDSRLLVVWGGKSANVFDVATRTMVFSCAHIRHVPCVFLDNQRLLVQQQHVSRIDRMIANVRTGKCRRQSRNNSTDQVAVSSDHVAVANYHSFLRVYESRAMVRKLFILLVSARSLGPDVAWSVYLADHHWYEPIHMS